MNLNADQQAAVDCTAARIACLAAPGAGKTRVLVARVLRLLDARVYPGEIVCLTFTRKAGREMRERLEAAGVPGRVTRKLVVSTFHAWAARLLREFAQDLGIDPLFTIRDDADKDDLIRWAGAELGVKHTSPRRLWQNEEVRDRYEQLLREAHAIDYDGLETGLLELLHTDVARTLRDRYQHVLIDEAQDTSELQQRILDALAPRNLFIVGDPGQAIYGFRGAKMEGFIAMTQREGWVVLTLRTNYRSEPDIVDAATRIGAAMTPPGLVQVAAREHVSSEEGVFIWELETVDEAIETTARDIQREIWRGADMADMAVLSPTWAHAEHLAEILAARGVPGVVARRASRIWDSEEARWLVSVLRVAVNRHDHLALRYAVNAFRVRVPLWQWARARAAAASDGSPVEDHLGDSWEVVRWAVGTARDAIADPELTGTAAIGLCATYLVDDLARLHLSTRADRMGDVVEAVYAWARPFYAVAERPGVTDFLTWYATRELADTEAPDAADQPQLMTIHAAKGLEWSHVWVLGACEGELPRPSGDVEEQRRLFYVATTRAKDRCTWVAWGTPSRFFAEADGRVEVA